MKEYFVAIIKRFLVLRNTQQVCFLVKTFGYTNYVKDVCLYARQLEPYRLQQKHFSNALRQQQLLVLSFSDF